MITERQKGILDRIIEEYIRQAKPVGSQLLEKKGDFGICPATIRIEMQKLTQEGFLFQPHTSAGRIPTDKGYRFFVDNLFEKGFLDFENESFFEEISQLEREMENSFKFLQILTKKITEFTSDFVISVLPEKEILFKEGWRKILKEPEFENSSYFSKFAEMIENWEKEIKKIEKFLEIYPVRKSSRDIKSGQIRNFSNRVKVFIGKENPFSKTKDFSIIISGCRLPEKERGIIAILGPKRMVYQKNISLINSISKLLEEL